MTELSIHAARITMSHQPFHDEQPVFDTLVIETEDRHGAKDRVTIFLSDIDSERLGAAVEAFNEVWAA